MDRARNIVGIYPTNTEDIERTASNIKETTLMNTAIKFLYVPFENPIHHLEIKNPIHHITNMDIYPNALLQYRIII